jgi:hypothetical protein
MIAFRHARALAAAAGALVLAPLPASAQAVPLSADEMNAVALYAMPHAFRSLQARCTGQVPANAYMFAQGPVVSARLEQAARGQFPAARAAVTRLATRNDPQMATILQALPAENVEPLVSELIAGKVRSEVKQEDCAQINQVLELLDPLPPENLATLMGIFALRMEGRGDNGGGAVTGARAQ